jgi:hypothetical protein
MTMMNAKQAAKSLGITTRRFNAVRQSIGIRGVCPIGRENARDQLAILIYTPAQVATIADESSKRDGNGKLI